MTQPLQGRTVALAEGRQLEELAEMLAREGATPLRCPLVSMLDAPDPDPVLAWLGQLRAGQFSHVVFLTGEGLRRLLGFAERAGQRDATIAALGKTRTITRGPKPGKVLREIGLTATRVASTPTTEGVIETLRSEELRGCTVGVQLYAPENPALLDFLQAVGAKPVTVLPYVYAPAADGERVTELIGQLAAGQVDVLVFTSSPQVDRLYEVAAERGLAEPLRQGLERVKVAAVGPIVAEDLRGRGATVHICPEQGFVMKNLVQKIVAAFNSR
jgi:uroporphyrinogen-III synthase